MNIKIYEEALLKSIIKTCDLLFMTISDNSKQSINNVVHIGILKNENNEEIEIKIIESDEKEGIICTPLKYFIEKKIKLNNFSRFYIKRIKNLDKNDINKLIYETEKQIGKESNYTSKEGKNPLYLIEIFKKLNLEIIKDKIDTTLEQIMKSDILENICEINNNDNVLYSFYKIENDQEIFNMTKKALNESYNDIWTQFEKKIKLNPDLEVIGTRPYINGEFKDYKFIKISECFSLAEKIGNGLAAIGLKENDMVLEYMNQRIEVPIINMGIWRQGGIIAPKSQGNVNIKDFMNQIEPKFVVLTPEYINSFYECCQQLNLEKKKIKTINIILLPYPNGPDQDKEIFNEDIIKMFKELDIQIFKYNEILNLGEKNKFERKKINPENIAFIINSSGTSQTTLKSICLSHKNVIAVTVLNGLSINNSGSYKILLHSTFGHASDCLDNACAMLCPNFCMGFRSNGQMNYFEDIKLLKPNANYVIPITLKNLYDEYNLKLKEGMSKQASIEYILHDKLGGKMKYVNNFGCGVSKEITDWCIDDLKFNFSNYYGATEAVFIFSEIISDSKKPNNYISNKPKYVEIRVKEIRFNDDAFITEFNEENKNYKIIRGELLVKSENVMLGYYKNKELTEKVLDKDNYYHTGDVIEYNTKTHDITLVDRLNNLIILSNGAKIPASSLENSIMSNPLFKQCLVFGFENDIKLFCVIVLNNGLLKNEFNNFEENYEKINDKVIKEMNKIYKDNQFPELWKFNKIILEFNEWTLEEGLITSSGKIIRKAVIEKYKNKID